MLQLFIAVILENFKKELVTDKTQLKPTHLALFRTIWLELWNKANEWTGINGRKDASWLPAPYLRDLLLRMDQPIGLNPDYDYRPFQLMHIIRILDIPITDNGDIEYSSTLRAIFRSLHVDADEFPDVDENGLPNRGRISAANKVFFCGAVRM